MAGVSRRDVLRGSLLAMGSVAAAAPTEEFEWLSLAEVSELIRTRRVSPVELTRLCLARIEKLNSSLNAFITVTAEDALDQASELEKEQAKGRFRSALHGIPIALKDLIDTAGVRTTAASAHLASRVPSEDAWVAGRLKAAGAVLLGKLNMDEFAYNFTSETSYFGPIHNPWNLRMTPGGSSGGSAAAVAAGLCFGALGSDTGGSIRLPASLCGIVGLKPTFGRVSTRGVLPLSWSLDHVGPMCRSTRDAAMLLGAIAGYDPDDPDSVDMPVPDYVSAVLHKPAKLRLGIPRAIFYDNLDPEVESAVNTATSLLAGMTAGVQEVALPPVSMDDAGKLPALEMVLRAEAYAYHARRLAESPEKFHPGTRQTVESAASISLTDYIRGRREMETLRHQVRKVFEEERVDLLLTPSVSRPAFPLGGAGAPDLVYLRNTMLFNLYGLPAVSIPCGFTKQGLPIGLQIAGPAWGEGAVLSLAHAYETATMWHTRRPPLA